MGKLRQMNMNKEMVEWAGKLGERLFIDISSMEQKVM